MLAQNRIGAGRIDDGDLAQECRRVVVDDDALTGRLLRPGLAVVQQMDPAGRRRNTLRHDRLADQRVDECRLAGVELTNDDQQEECLDLILRLLDQPQILIDILDLREVARQRLSLHQQVLDPLAKLLLAASQDASCRNRLLVSHVPRHSPSLALVCAIRQWRESRASQ